MRRRTFLATLAATPAAFGSIARSQTPRRSLGLRFLDRQEFVKLDKALPTQGITPPRGSVRPYLPPVNAEGQKQQGSCVGWAVGYGLASSLIKKKTGTQVLTSPSFIFNRGLLVDSFSNQYDYLCTEGMFIETALSYLQGFGILPWSDFPYDEQECATLPMLSQDKAARTRKVIRDWKVAPKLSMVKDSITAGRPALIGLQVREAFMEEGGPVLIDQDIDDAIVGGHAMLVVGYDDKMPTAGGKKGAFEVMNSWGPNWRNEGFAWISYDTVLRDASFDGELRLYIVTEA